MWASSFRSRIASRNLGGPPLRHLNAPSTAFRAGGRHGSFRPPTPSGVEVISPLLLEESHRVRRLPHGGRLGCLARRPTTELVDVDESTAQTPGCSQSAAHRWFASVVEEGQSNKKKLGAQVEVRHPFGWRRGHGPRAALVARRQIRSVSAPTIPDLDTYGMGRDQRNRLSASDVLYVVPTRSVRTATRRLRVALATATLFFALLVGLVALDQAPVLLLAPYCLFSVVGFGMYRADKIAAERGAWRTQRPTFMPSPCWVAGRAPWSRNAVPGASVRVWVWQCGRPVPRVTP